ncbi:FAD-dependent oxidoreductase [Phenylobacterium sp.]|uniref:FAD-dependent oxidoreductase n=1 Tax=Phenylobacterium sp. TaxID=1871053 RepID=UPI002B77965B|nr:FAD-dependent oxidoreductase [Phenylobacterium sp.]HLZ76340.1 FAD-dependent oxidoreductase [Phenylobacterium sp.]
MPPRLTALDRRQLLLGSAGAGLLSLGGCATAGAGGPAGGPISTLPFAERSTPIWPVHARMDRVFDITVCLRPFRAQGPRIEAEQVGDALVVHNYGHGGSGWSLSWGSGTLAVRKAMANSPREVAVVGCGAIGLSSAILAQEAGAKVTIYARDLLPDARSARATGSWTPDSRIALADKAGPQFAAQWEEMTRISFKRFRRYLGLADSPVEWSDRYFLSDPPTEPAPVKPEGARTGPELQFVDFRDRIRDLTPRAEVLAPGASPFPGADVRRTSQMQFNVADYGHTLMADFLAMGGRVEHREFQSLGDLATLKEKVVINCPGYGARALCRDESITPVRGQIAWLIPQPEVNYGVFYKDVSLLSRRDGIVVQALWGGDMFGYGNDQEVIDRAEAERAVRTIAELYGRMKG